MSDEPLYCSCECHDQAGIRHFMPCCGQCYEPRAELAPLPPPPVPKGPPKKVVFPKVAKADPCPHCGRGEGLGTKGMAEAIATVQPMTGGRWGDSLPVLFKDPPKYPTVEVLERFKIPRGLVLVAEIGDKIKPGERIETLEGGLFHVLEVQGFKTGCWGPHGKAPERRGLLVQRLRQDA